MARKVTSRSIKPRDAGHEDDCQAGSQKISEDGVKAATLLTSNLKKTRDGQQ